MEEVIVIGGGLAGLISAIGLAQNGIGVTLIEKKQYPFHRVCGEYISNEVLPYLQHLQLELSGLQPARINRFQLSSARGKLLEAPLALGGFGLSRFTLDQFLYQAALQRGVQFRLKTTVETVQFSEDAFTVRLSDGSALQSRLVIGAFGKRSNLDRSLNRDFFRARSPYLAVKYHLRTDFPRDTIALHNFENGYAGLSAIENDKYCFCYLTSRQHLKRYKTLGEMELKVLARNPILKRVFSESEFLYPQPEVINEISFDPKAPIVNHILCGGDAAGLITPLCGNGMAMAIQAGKFLTESVTAYFREHRNRQLLETTYARAWQNQFQRRLQTGRLVQRLFGQELISELVVGSLRQFPGALQHIIKQTHGQPF